MNSLIVVIFAACFAGICLSLPLQDSPSNPEFEGFEQVVPGVFQETLDTALSKLNPQDKKLVEDKIVSKFNESIKSIDDFVVNDLAFEVNNLVYKIMDDSDSMVQSINTGKVVLPKYGQIIDDFFTKVDKVMIPKLKSNFKKILKSTSEIVADYQGQLKNVAEKESKLLAQNPNSEITKALKQQKLSAQTLVKEFFERVDTEKENAVKVNYFKF